MILRAPFPELACCALGLGTALVFGPIALPVLCGPLAIQIARSKTAPTDIEIVAFAVGFGCALLGIFLGANWGPFLLFAGVFALIICQPPGRLPVACIAGVSIGLGIFGAEALQAPALLTSIPVGAAGVIWLAYWNRQNHEQLADLTDKVERRSARVRYLLQERDEVTALAVHDLQSPIQAVAGMQKTLLMMLDTPAPDHESMKVALSTAIETNNDLSERIGSLLSSNRDHLGGDAVATPLEQIVQATIATHKMEISNRQLRVSCDLDQGLSLQNQEDVKDVLDVLLDNAIQYTQIGGQVLLRASLSGNRVCVSVHDDGDGVSPSRRSQLFVPPDSQTTKGGRRNLGLFLARRRAVRLGGGLEYSPSELGGAAFHAVFPKI